MGIFISSLCAIENGVFLDVSVENKKLWTEWAGTGR